MVRPSVSQLFKLFKRTNLCSWCADSFQILVFFLSSGPYTETFSFLFPNFFYFYECFSFLLTWDPMGWEQNLRNATPPSNHYRIFWNFSWTFFSIGLTKVVLDFWNFEFLILTNFLNSPLHPIGKQNPQLSKKKKKKKNERRAKWSEIWASVVSIQCIKGTLAVKCSRSFWSHLVHFRFLKTLYLESGWS